MGWQYKMAGDHSAKYAGERVSYNKHNLRKARHNAALRGYAYFFVKREMAHVEVCHNMLTN